MKISKTPPMTINPALETDVRPRQRPRKREPAAKISVSPEAETVARLDADLRAGPRTELVAEVRAMIDAGTFESSVDVDRVVDSLLADL